MSESEIQHFQDSYSNIEFIYPDWVTQRRDFLLSEINRIERQAQKEVEELHLNDPHLIEVKRREVIRQTQPYHDELVKIYERAIWNVRLSN